MNAHTTTRLTPELVGVGMKRLESIRAAAVAALVREMQTTIPAWTLAITTGEMPTDVPEWVLACCTSAALPGGGTSWESIQEALAQQTARHIERSILSEQVTGGSLSKFLCIDLEEFAREAWSGLQQYSPGTNQMEEA